MEECPINLLPRKQKQKSHEYNFGTKYLSARLILVKGKCFYAF